jgi:transporter family protein
LASWILPSLGYVVLLGVFGITLKYALRSLTWQELVVYTAGAYVIVAAIILATGTDASFHGGLNGAMAAIGAFIPPAAIVVLFIALNHGPASRVIPLTTAYPFITIVLAAIFLSEAFTWQSVLGSLLIVGGAIALSV